MLNFKHLVVPLTSIRLRTSLKLSTDLSALLDTALSTLQDQATNNLAREGGQASDALEWSSEDDFININGIGLCLVVICITITARAPKRSGPLCVKF